MKHRDGGISHGNKRGTSKSFMYYAYDNIEVYKREVLPYISDFSNKSVLKILQIYSYWINIINMNDDSEVEENERKYTFISGVVRATLRWIINTLNKVYNNTVKYRKINNNEENET